MFSLFKLFSNHALKQWAIFTLVSIVGVLVLSQFFKEYGVLLFLVFNVGFILVMMQTSQLVAKNLNWINALPLSKHGILGFNYIFSAFVWLLLAVSFFTIAASVTLLKGGFNDLSLAEIEQAMGSIIAFFSKSTESESWFSNHAVGLATFCIIAFSFFHMTCMNLVNPTTLRQTYWNIWNHSDPKRRQLYRGGVVALALAVFSAFHYFKSGFGQVIFWCSFLTLFPALNASISLKLNKKQRHTLLGASAAAVALQLGIVYHLASNGAHSSSNQRQIASVLFLGKIGTNASQEKVAQLLEGDISQEDFSKLSKFYLENFNQGRKIKKNQDPYLHFNTLVNAKKSKCSYCDISSAVSIFDPSDLEYADLTLLFDKIVAASPDRPGTAFYFYLLNTQLTPLQLAELLESGNEVAIRYGLLRSRYTMDSNLISIIERHLPDYNDDLKISALKSLSVLSGHYVGLDQLAESKNGRKLASTLTPTHCETFKINRVQEINESNLPALNQCIRKKADRKNTKLLETLETLGWIDLPLTSFKTQAIKSAFQIN